MRIKRSLLLLSALLLAACQFPLPEGQSGVSQKSTPIIRPLFLDEDNPAMPSVDSSVSATNTGSVLATVSSAGVLVLGDEAAPVSIVLFFNHASPYSKSFFDVLYPELRGAYLLPGRASLSLVPVAFEKYPQSTMMAGYLLCGAAQNKAETIHRLLLAGVPSADTLEEHEVDVFALRSCLNLPETMAAVTQQQGLAAMFGVDLVPVYFINGDKFTGLPEWADLKGQVEEALDYVR